MHGVVQRYQFDINLYLIILHICVSSGIKVILKIDSIQLQQKGPNTHLNCPRILQTCFE